MEVNVENEGTMLIVSPRGKLDGENGVLLEQTLMPDITGTNNKVAMNMENVNGVTNDGIRGLLTLIQRATMMRGQLVIYNASESFLQILQQSGLESFFTIAGDKDDAVGKLEG
jgi:anti-anti-sigma factor